MFFNKPNSLYKKRTTRGDLLRNAKYALFSTSRLTWCTPFVTTRGMNEGGTSCFRNHHSLLRHRAPLFYCWHRRRRSLSEATKKTTKLKTLIANALWVPLFARWCVLSNSWSTYQKSRHYFDIKLEKVYFKCIFEKFEKKTWQILNI